MRHLGLAAGAVFLAGAAGALDVPAAYQGTWTLTDIDRAPFYGGATLVMTGPGTFAGQAPCNQYSGTAAGALPAFQVTQVAATRMSCPMLEMEHQYFAVLKGVVSADLVGPDLYLSTVNGVKLHYVATGN